MSVEFALVMVPLAWAAMVFPTPEDDMMSAVFAVETEKAAWIATAS
jgi:hypothetical protein